MSNGTYQRTELPPGQSGQVKPTFDLADRGGQIQLAGVVGGMAGNIWDRLIRTKTAHEEHEFMGMVNTHLADFEGKIKTTPGAPLEQQKQWLNEMLADIKKAGSTAQTRLGKERIRNFYARNENLIRKRAEKSLEAIESDRARARTKLLEDEYIETGMYSELKDLYFGSDDNDRPGLSGNQLDSELAELLFRERAGELIQGKILREALAMSEAEGLEWIESANEDTKSIDAVAATKEYGVGDKLFSPDDIATLKNEYRLQLARAQAEAKDAAAVQAEAWRADALIRLRNRELTYADVDNAPIPTTGDLGRQEFYNLLEAQEKDALKGADIVNDVQVEAELEGMAYDIWTGAVTKSEFDAALNRARYSEKPDIDDSAYDSLASLAAREHKAYQARALKDAISHAQTQLVTVQESLIESLFAIVEDDEDKRDAEDMKNRRKLELANLDRYRKSLNDWFKANPDADADQIYKQSRKMLSQYRKMTLKDISRARESFEAWLSPEQFLVSLPAQIGKFQQTEKAPRPGSAAKFKDGTEIGTYNSDGTITLNANGLRMLKRATGGDKELARRIIKEKGFVIPEE